MGNPTATRSEKSPSELAHTSAATEIWHADPEFAEAFRAYANYFEDLAGTIHRLYGRPESLAEGVHDGVADHPATAKIQRRQLDESPRDQVEKAFRKAWGTLRRLGREIEDPEVFDEEANAWIPIQAYFSVYHAVCGYAAASGQTVPRDHATARKLAGKEVTRGALPHPWDGWCEGCPPNFTVRFGGQLVPMDKPVHALSNPDPRFSEDRFAMFLRTTRKRELERCFNQERRKKVKHGRSKRNLSYNQKKSIANNMAPTTLFDVFWRVRKKANYDDADTFVLGSEGAWDARRFGESLIIVTDATVAALEALTAAACGPVVLAELSRAYATKTSSGPESPLGQRERLWNNRRSGSSRP